MLLKNGPDRQALQFKSCAPRASPALRSAKQFGLARQIGWTGGNRFSATRPFKTVRVAEAR
jgi:hypothetical protein